MVLLQVPDVVGSSSKRASRSASRGPFCIYAVFALAHPRLPRAQRRASPGGCCASAPNRSRRSGWPGRFWRCATSRTRPLQTIELAANILRKQYPELAPILDRVDRSVDRLYRLNYAFSVYESQIEWTDEDLSPDPNALVIGSRSAPQARCATIVFSGSRTLALRARAANRSRVTEPGGRGRSDA